MFNRTLSTHGIASVFGCITPLVLMLSLQACDQSAIDSTTEGPNPCSNNNGGCSSDAICSVQNDQAVCTCKSGYQGDGITCSDVNECATNNGGCGSATFYTCTNNIGTAPSCADIDECTTNT